MNEYPKIETIYDRDPESFGIIPGQLRRSEYGLIPRWLVTEKIDGTNVRVFVDDCDPSVGYAGVRFGGRTDNAQMPTRLLAYLAETFTPERVCKVFEEGVQSAVFYGEGYGPKIQNGGGYRGGEPSFRLFDVRVGDWWLNWPDVEDVARKLGIETVPVLSESLETSHVVEWVQQGIYSKVAQAEKDDPNVASEGVVCRTDPLLFDRRGHRVMWKLKTKDFRRARNADSATEVGDGH